MSVPPCFSLTVIYTPERSDMKHLLSRERMFGSPSARISPSRSGGARE